MLRDDWVNLLKLTFFMSLFLPYGDQSSGSLKLTDWYLFEGNTGMKKVNPFVPNVSFLYLPQGGGGGLRVRFFNQTILAVKKDIVLYKESAFL